MKLKVNGSEYETAIAPDTPLLYFLRNELALNGAKFGCGLGQCCACLVLVDGNPMQSCLMPVGDVQGMEVVTLEGLGGADNPSPLQRAFIEEQAAQCGYCISGMIVQAQALLNEKPDPSDAEIREALQPNLCRCGTHMRILRAVKRAAGQLRSGEAAAIRGGDASP